MEGAGIQLLPAFPYTDPLLAAVDTLDQFLQPKLINFIYFLLVIWLAQGQLWASDKAEAALLIQC